jgi:hypothetical protein
VRRFEDAEFPLIFLKFLGSFVEFENKKSKNPPRE